MAIKGFGALILFLGGGLLGLFWGLVRPFHRNNNYLISRLWATWGPTVLGAQVFTQGSFPSKGPFVVVSNHQSVLDLIFGSCILPPSVVTLGKKEILFYPIFGLFYWLAGNILIDRTSVRKSMQSMAKVQRALKDQGISVWIMPEGTRVSGGKVGPFKKGAFYTAIDAGVPIVPVAFSKIFLGVGQVWISILPPLPTEGLSRKDVNALKEDCHKKVAREVERLNCRN